MEKMENSNSKNIWTLLVLIVALFVLSYFFFFSEGFGQVNSFDECVEAGYPVLDSYPEQCETPEGERFFAFEEKEGWETFISEEGFMFMYPEDLGLTYIEAVDWPPQFHIAEEEFMCVDAGEETDRTGRTQSREIGGRDYCLTEVKEGALGSVFTQYAYGTEAGDNLVAYLTFSTRAPECLNFGEPEMNECQREQSDFNPDLLADGIVETLRINGQTRTPIFDSGDASQPIVLEGTFACLPHRDTDGPVTLECAFGLLDEEGNYYALRDSNLSFSNLGTIATGEDIRVSGTFTPEPHERYQSVGTIEVEELVIIE